MADGKVLIDSKINTAGVTKGAAEIKKAMEQTAQTVGKAADNIEKSFENKNYKKAFKKLPEAAKEAYAEIELARANDLLDNQHKADRIAKIYQNLGDDQASAQKRAWAIIEAETTDGSHKVIDDLKDISNQAKKTGKDVEGTGDKLSEALDKTKSNFKDFFGATLASDLVVSGLKEIGSATLELGKQAVQFAAEINASNAQFEQTFKGVEETARATLKSISEQVGITETRMQDGYTAIYAFAKSVGADTPQALEIASRAMVVAADSAAYYDRSMEDALDTVLSYIKGNYENDAALGFASTETTRAAKANEMYAKSFQDLTAAQNVDVLLAMIEGANEASGALGQAAREADSWTNVTGELQEAWRLLLGVMGDPLLKNLIPIVQQLTEWMQALIDKAASEELAEGMDNFGESIARIETQFEKNSQTIEKNAVLADYYKQKLEDLEKQGFEPASAASREYAHAVEQLNEIYPDLNLKIDEHTGLVTADTKANLDNLESMKERAFMAAQEEMLTEAVRAQAEAKADLALAEQQLFDIQDQRKMLQDQLAMSDEELAWAMEHRILAAADLSYAETQLLDQVIALNKEEQALKNTYAEGQAQVEEFDNTINQITGSIQAWEEQHSESVSNISESTQEAVAKTGEAVAEQNKETLSQIEANTAETVNTIAQDAANAANAFESDFSTPTKENAEATGEALSESLSNAAETMEESWKDKAKWFSSNVETPINQSVENVRKTALDTWSKIEEENAAAWERMVKNVENAIREMQSSINSLQGKTVTVTVNQVTNSSSASAAEAAYVPAAASEVPIGIPMLATGAVIPPHAPFMAVLGDQPSGVNIEAPLETIKQAMAEVTSDQNIDVHLHVDGDLEQLVRYLHPYFEAEKRRIGPSLSESFISG